MNKKILISFVFIPFISFGANQYNQFILDGFSIGKHNTPGTEDELEDEIILNEDKLTNQGNICEVKFTNLNKKDGAVFGGALTSINIKTSKDTFFNKGNLISHDRKFVNFENMNVSTSSTYINSSSYYALYALDEFKGDPANEFSGLNYWLPNLQNDWYSLKFKNPTYLKQIIWSDSITKYCQDGDRSPKIGYNVEVYDCNGDLSFIKTINKQYNNPCTNPADFLDKIVINFID